jgi:hypothetical protein
VRFLSRSRRKSLNVSEIDGRRREWFLNTGPHADDY